MNQKDNYRWILGVAAGLSLLALAAGCHSNDYQHGESYPTGDQGRAVYRIADVQSARGARQDSTLHDCHFEGAQLNTLGQERLDQMLADGDVYSILVVYLDVPEQSALAPRQQAVSIYLKDRGLKDDQIRLENGPNPNSTTAVVPTMPPEPAQNAQQQMPSSPQAPAAAPPAANR
jgi:hypothetical protein